MRGRLRDIGGSLSVQGFLATGKDVNSIRGRTTGVPGLEVG